MHLLADASVLQALYAFAQAKRTNIQGQPASTRRHSDKGYNSGHIDIKRMKHTLCLLHHCAPCRPLVMLCMYSDINARLCACMDSKCRHGSKGSCCEAFSEYLLMAGTLKVPCIPEGLMIEVRATVCRLDLFYYRVTHLCHAVTGAVARGFRRQRASSGAACPFREFRRND